MAKVVISGYIPQTVADRIALYAVTLQKSRTTVISTILEDTFSKMDEAPLRQHLLEQTQAIWNLKKSYLHTPTGIAEAFEPFLQSVDKDLQENGVSSEVRDMIRKRLKK